MPVTENSQACLWTPDVANSPQLAAAKISNTGQSLLVAAVVSAEFHCHLEK